MHLLQRVKAPMSSLCKAQATKLLLVVACLFLCSTVLSMFGGTGTAYAASVGSRSVGVRPATSGGGCISGDYIRACLSENSEGALVPDIYILTGPVCRIRIYLVQNEAFYTEDDLGTRCFSAGTHLYGFSADAIPGYTWVGSADGLFNGSFYTATVSPPLFT